MAEQRVTTVYAAVLCEIGLHLAERSLLWVSLMAQVNNRRLRNYCSFVHPLPDVAVIFSKTQAQRVGLHHPGSNGACQQVAVNIPFQFNVVRHAPGVWQR